MARKITQEEFRRRVEQVFGKNTYDLRKAVYRGQAVKVSILCAKHGLFQKTPSKLWSGSGCPHCAAIGKFDTTTDFITKALAVHGARYDYSQVAYKSSRDKLQIICRTHGLFIQEARTHLSGKGCPECGRLARRVPDEEKQLRLFTASVIARRRRTRALAKHRINEAKRQSKYMQHLAELRQASAKRRSNKQGRQIQAAQRAYPGYTYKIGNAGISALCKRHALEFPISNLRMHLRGHQQCPECRKEHNRAAREQRTLQNMYAYAEEIVKKAREMHGDRYNYSLVLEHGLRPGKRLRILCPDHGEFVQSRTVHIRNGGGCPKCAHERINQKLKRDTDHFVASARKKYGNTYLYINSVYRGKAEPVTVTCRKHGDFSVIAANHMHHKTNYGGCPVCKPPRIQSHIEVSVRNWLRKHTDIVVSDRTLIHPYEIDMYVPSTKVGIEVNGTYWHSSKFKERTYHYKKALLAKKAGIQLLQFWEHELYAKPAIVKSMILARLGKSKRMYARKLVITELSVAERRAFFETNHLQGDASARVCYGLFDADGCVAAMSFGTPRFNSKYQWELIRFANAINVTVVGGASKLWKHFLREHSPETVLSYADLRISQGMLYKQLGFVYRGVSAPGYFWMDTKYRQKISRHAAQKHKLDRLLGDRFSPEVSERGNMEAAGYLRVFDAGNMVCTWSAR